MKLKTIAITGASSMIGAAVIKAAVARGIKVLAFVRSGSKRLGQIPKSPLVQIFECDLDKMSGFDLALLRGQTADCFFHLGWGWTDHQGRTLPQKQALNIQASLDAAGLAQKMGCKKFIGAGSQAEYGRSSVPLNDKVPCWPEVPYGICKLAAGRLCAIACEQAGMQFNWVRILSVYGANDSEATLVRTYIKNCKENLPMDLGPCSHPWDFLYADDAGEALLAIAQNGADQKTYCLGSGAARPLKEFLADIKSVVNPAYSGERFGAVPYGPKSLRFLQADISDLTADTGWTPKTSFIDGIKKTVQELDGSF